MDGLIFVTELDSAVVKQLMNWIFISSDVPEFLCMLDGELERLDGAIEADDAQFASHFFCGGEDGQDICGGAEADVPDDELAAVGGDAVGQVQLADVEGLRFSGGADDGMKGFILGNRVHAEGAVRQFDQFVIVH